MLSEFPLSEYLKEAPVIKEAPDVADDGCSRLEDVPHKWVYYGIQVPPPIPSLLRIQEEPLGGLVHISTTLCKGLWRSTSSCRAGRPLHILQSFTMQHRSKARKKL